MVALMIPNSYQTPNFSADRLLSLLTGDEYKVLHYAIRQTLGFQRDQARISISQFSSGKKSADGSRVLDAGTGLSKPTVMAILKVLHRIGVVRQLAPNNIQNEGILYGVCITDECVDYAMLEQRLLTNRAAARQKMTPIRAKRAVNGINHPAPAVEVVNAIDGGHSMPLNGAVNGIDTQNPVLNQDLNPDLIQEESAATSAAIPAAFVEEEEDLTQEYDLPADDLTPSPDELPAPPGSGLSSPSATTVVNIRDEGVLDALRRGDPEYVYCGRANGRYGVKASIWQNTHRIEKDTVTERRAAIQKFKDDLLSNDDLMARLPELRGKRLVCHCHPLPCHGDVLAAYADGLGDSTIPAPEGYVTMYASHSGKTAHFVAVGATKTVCGLEASPYLLKVPKIGKAYETCQTCQAALDKPIVWNIGDAAYYPQRIGMQATPRQTPSVIVSLTAQRVKIAVLQPDGGTKVSMVTPGSLIARRRDGELEAWEAEALAAQSAVTTTETLPQTALTKAMYLAIPEDIRPASCHYGKNDAAAQAVMKAGWTAAQVGLFTEWLYAENKWYRAGNDGTPVIISMHTVDQKIKGCWPMVERWDAKRKPAGDGEQPAKPPINPFEYSNQKYREKRDRR